LCIDYVLYGRLYLPTGRLDALYSTRLSPTLQALVAAISDPPSNTPASSNLSNVMLSLQHDVGKWCTEYTWSAEDSMWGIRVLRNFGRLANPNDSSTEEGDKSASASGYQQDLKRIDEEDPVEGGLKGRVSAGAEIYFSAKEKSAGGLSQSIIYSNMQVNDFHSVHWYPFHYYSRRHSTFVSSPTALVISTCHGIQGSTFATPDNNIHCL
jgi:Mitochondrial distribution and morphology protein 10